MRQNGAALIVLGLLIVFWAFVMDTTVYSSPSLIGDSLVGGGSTHNLGLMQNQMMVLHTGLVMFLAGIFLVASGRPASDIGNSARQETDEELEEREDRQRRALRIALTVIAALIIGVFILTWVNSRELAAENSDLIEINVM